MTAGNQMNVPQDEVPASFLLAGQFQHLLLLVALVLGALYVARPALDGGTWLGVSDRSWFYAAVAVTIVHQVVVAFIFRAQLVYSLMSRLFGRYDLAVWGAIFLPLLILRPLLTLGLALADARSLPAYRGAQIVAGLLLLPPTFYTLWSVGRYFGIGRALGGDHFRQRYRELPMVTEGAYRFSANAMYTFAFLGLWSIALLAGSRAALGVALFQHAYIWVHMYCTEAPDMRVIYG